jgi:hypothetical protein
LNWSGSGVNRVTLDLLGAMVRFFLSALNEIIVEGLFNRWKVRSRLSDIKIIGEGGSDGSLKREIRGEEVEERGGKNRSLRNARVDNPWRRDRRAEETGSGTTTDVYS